MEAEQHQEALPTSTSLPTHLDSLYRPAQYSSTVSAPEGRLQRKMCEMKKVGLHRHCAHLLVLAKVR